MATRSIKRRAKALCIIGLVFGLGGGCASCALDAIDHPLALLLKGLPITWENLERNAGRPLHIPATVAAGIASIATLPSLVRRLFQVR